MEIQRRPPPALPSGTNRCPVRLQRPAVPTHRRPKQTLSTASTLRHRIFARLHQRVPPKHWSSTRTSPS
eukprot:6497196-Lingulodinium_polyedra.AAC.1